MYKRLEARAATVDTVYRHTRNDAASAAISQDWAECRRLTQQARSIERAYPGVASRARFTLQPRPLPGPSSESLEWI